MTMLRYDPIRFLDDVNQLFNYGVARKGGDTSTLATSEWSPEVDIIEKPDAFHLHMELAGVKKENIDISMEGNLLSIKGKKESVTEDKSARYHRTERVYGEFHRQFSLPDTADSSKISASFADGVLELEIPKVEKQTIKTIEIKS